MRGGGVAVAKPQQIEKRAPDAEIPWIASGARGVIGAGLSLRSPPPRIIFSSSARFGAERRRVRSWGRPPRDGT